MRILFLCLFTLPLSGSVKGLSLPVLPPSLQNVHRIVCIGDSITQFGEAPGGYVWLFREYLRILYPKQGIQVVNVGIGGQRSQEMRERFVRDVIARKPDMVTISVGVNDVWHQYLIRKGTPLPVYRQNVEAMIQVAQRAGVRVVLLSPTIIYEKLDSTPNRDLIPYCQAMREIAQKYKTLFVDMQGPFRRIIQDYRDIVGAPDNLLTEDGVHMNPAGNRVMAHALMHTLGISSGDRLFVKGVVEKKLNLLQHPAKK